MIFFYGLKENKVFFFDASHAFCQMTLTVYINGKKYTETHPDPLESLVDYLRRKGLTGTKVGCAEGSVSHLNLTIVGVVLVQFLFLSLITLQNLSNTIL